MHQVDFLRVISDETDVCPYLPAQTSRLPLSIPTSTVTAERLDVLLAAGYRRTGWYYYRTQCPRCSACEPLRLAAKHFQPSRSQRRARKLGDQKLRVEWCLPSIDETHIQLFNKHRALRGLSVRNDDVSAMDYQSFLVNSTCPTLELQLWYEDQLVAISITDVGVTSLSAVYCCFDPDYSWLGLGNYAILQQIRQATASPESSPFGAKEWLYLGLYVGENTHLNYKAKYGPHERRIAGQWTPFARH